MESDRSLHSAAVGEAIDETRYRERSLWLDGLAGRLDPRPPLAADAECDVAIVGAGFTGLWAAYYLVRQRPELRVVVVEREIAGFGPSGRNGGWAGGYSGHGVVAAHVSGRTLADLVLGTDSELVHLPWLGLPAAAAALTGR